MVSTKFKAVLPSPTVSLNNKFAELKERGEKAISFGVGEPDATTPEVVIDYAAQKAREGKTHYTSSLGIKELREKIAQKYSSMTGKGVVPKNVIVCGRLKHQLFPSCPVEKRPTREDLKES